METLRRPPPPPGSRLRRCALSLRAGFFSLMLQIRSGEAWEAAGLGNVGVAGFLAWPGGEAATP